MFMPILIDDKVYTMIFKYPEFFQLILKKESAADVTEWVNMIGQFIQSLTTDEDSKINIIKHLNDNNIGALIGILTEEELIFPLGTKEFILAPNKELCVNLNKDKIIEYYPINKNLDRNTIKMLLTSYCITCLTYSKYKFDEDKFEHYERLFELFVQYSILVGITYYFFTNESYKKFIERKYYDKAHKIGRKSRLACNKAIDDFVNHGLLLKGEHYTPIKWFTRKLTFIDIIGENEGDIEVKKWYENVFMKIENAFKVKTDETIKRFCEKREGIDSIFTNEASIQCLLLLLVLNRIDIKALAELLVFIEEAYENKQKSKGSVHYDNKLESRIIAATNYKHDSVSKLKGTLAGCQGTYFIKKISKGNYLVNEEIISLACEDTRYDGFFVNINFENTFVNFVRGIDTRKTFENDKPDFKIYLRNDFNKAKTNTEAEMFILEKDFVSFDVIAENCSNSETISTDESMLFDINQDSRLPAETPHYYEPVSNNGESGTSVTKHLDLSFPITENDV